MNLTDKQKQFVELAISEGFGETITTRDIKELQACLLYTSPSPRDVEESRMPSSA